MKKKTLSNLGRNSSIDDWSFSSIDDWSFSQTHKISNIGIKGQWKISSNKKLPSVSLGLGTTGVSVQYSPYWANLACGS